MEIKDLEINKALPVVPLSDKEMSTVIGGQAPVPPPGPTAKPTAKPAPPAAPAPPVKRFRTVAGRWVEVGPSGYV